MTTQELYDLIDENILTGGRRTMAENERMVLKKIVDEAKTAIKHYEGVTAPNSTHNLSQGYEKFSLGILNDGSLYICTASTNISATWVALSGRFTSNFVVSLANGKTLGKLTNGQTALLAGKTLQQGLEYLGIEDIYPTYVNPTIAITQSAAATGEVGEAVSNTVTATFTKNDAGNLTAIRIQKNGVDLTPNGTTSPFVKVDSAVRVNGNISYRAFADYSAGALKNITPGNTPDDRTPAVRSINAPQAASTDFGSATINLAGVYKIFYGPTSVAPDDSAEVRALGSSLLITTAGAIVIQLNTGSTEKIFSVSMPATRSLTGVSDLTVSGADITSQYVLTTFNVNDAFGTPVAYKTYTMQQAVAYSSNHVHQLTIT